MTIASAFNDIAVAQGGTAAKSGAITAAIDALNDALAGSDQPQAKTIEQAVRLLGEHIGGGGGGGDYEWTSLTSIASVSEGAGDVPTFWMVSQKDIFDEFMEPTVPYMSFETQGSDIPTGLYCTLAIPQGYALNIITSDEAAIQDYKVNEYVVSFRSKGSSMQVDWKSA